MSHSNITKAHKETSTIRFLQTHGFIHWVVVVTVNISKVQTDSSSRRKLDDSILPFIPLFTPTEEIQLQLYRDGSKSRSPLSEKADNFSEREIDWNQMDKIANEKEAEIRYDQKER